MVVRVSIADVIRGTRARVACSPRTSHEAEASRPIVHPPAVAPTRTRRHRICAVLAAVVVAGCAATAQIDLASQVRTGLRDTGGIRAIHYDAPWMRVRNTSFGPEKFLPIEAPVKQVKDRFLSTATRDLGLTNVRMIDQPRPADIYAIMAPPIGQLKREFGSGLVFDFYSPLFEIWQAYAPFPWSPRRYLFGTMVRARLIRLDDSTILWQQACLLNGLTPEERTAGEWKANDFALVKTVAERQARYCADDLVARFLREDRSR